MIISEKQIIQLISLVSHAINLHIGEIWKSEAAILIDNIKSQQSEELKVIE